MVANRNSTKRLTGLYYKARCEFLLGRAEDLKATLDLYDTTLTSIEKLNPKWESILTRAGSMIRMMYAILQNDADAASALMPSMHPLSTSKPSECFTTYLKALAALTLCDRDEAMHRFMTIKENYPKTVFATYADKYLSDMTK
jgi:hypothetical protein